MVLLSGSWAYVAAVGVAPAHRRKGIARALVSRGEEIAIEARKPWLVLDVDASNDPARKLYAELGWSCGFRVVWWKLPSVSAPASPDDPRTDPAHAATADDLAFARSRSQATLPLPLPPPFLQPVELICRGRGDTVTNWAAGPVGSPTYLARACFSRPGASAFLLGVASENSSSPEAAAVIVAGRDALARAGAADIFAPVRETDPISGHALESVGATRLVASETWGKSLPG
jgi:hypothetical protein